MKRLDYDNGTANGDWQSWKRLLVESQRGIQQQQKEDREMINRLVTEMAVIKFQSGMIAAAAGIFVGALVGYFFQGIA